MSKEHVVACILDKNVLGLESNILLLTAHIPPEGSTFYVGKNENDGITLLESDILDLRSLYPDCELMLMGDLNAPTGEELDYILDDDIRDMPIDDWYAVDYFNTPRFSMDKHVRVNKFGLSLLELCCDHGIHMLNGRTEDDKCGKFTYSSKHWKQSGRLYHMWFSRIPDGAQVLCRYCCRFRPLSCCLSADLYSQYKHCR